MDTARWNALAAHFDAALALPPEQRRDYVERATADDPGLRAELQSLLRAHQSDPGFLEEQPVPEARAFSQALRPGDAVGAWRVVRLLGHGGMGEVYEVARADGQFEQRAAMKVMRAESARFLDRFNAERQILARLEHPGIVRLLDGGMTGEGRPYAVMEYVEGEPITQWCEARSAPLRQRLDLFVQVCSAVQHAHEHLVVHRDIKPGNVLVDAAGRARLLDFGVAKLLGTDVVDPAAGAATALLLTPDYAAPEQLTGDPITTSTDVHALGMLLFELLTGTRPRPQGSRSLAHLVRSVLNESIPLASEAAAQAAATGLPPRELRGDVDAIIARCLRIAPRARYGSVDALRLEIMRVLQGEPVLARSGARWYRFGWLLRRYSWEAAAAAIVLIALGVGTGVSLWQARIARQEARNAAATRDFLIDVFRAADPRIVGDRPPGEITARELLDASVARIEREFAQDPGTQLQLLGVVSEIYGNWNDERFADLQVKRRELAERHFGRTHPVYIESLLLDVWEAIYAQDYGRADDLLQQADRLIEKGGHRGQLPEAQYWVAKAEALRAGSRAQRKAALDRAVQLNGELAPQSLDYAIALANSAVAHLADEELDVALEHNQKAIAVFRQAKPPADNEMAMTLANLARTKQQLGDYAGAEAAYAEFDSIGNALVSTSAIGFWLGRADHARMVHLRGDTARAHQLFAQLLANIPADWDETVHDEIVREYYAERMAAEGRAELAVPLLEAAERQYEQRPFRDTDLRRLRRTLGDAYARLGRQEQAGQKLSAALEEYAQKDPPDSVIVTDARERWARWLLDEGLLDEAEVEFRAVLQAAGANATAPAAMSHAGMARIELARGQAALALRNTRAAIGLLPEIRHLHDVRLHPAVWRIHAEVLAANGMQDDSAEWLQRTVAEERRLNPAETKSVAAR